MYNIKLDYLLTFKLRFDYDRWCFGPYCLCQRQVIISVAAFFLLSRGLLLSGQCSELGRLLNQGDSVEVVPPEYFFLHTFDRQ